MPNTSSNNISAKDYTYYLQIGTNVVFARYRFQNFYPIKVTTQYLRTGNTDATSTILLPVHYYHLSPDTPNYIDNGFTVSYPVASPQTVVLHAPHVKIEITAFYNI